MCVPPVIVARRRPTPPPRAAAAVPSSPAAPTARRRRRRNDHNQSQRSHTRCSCWIGPCHTKSTTKLAFIHSKSYIRRTARWQGALMVGFRARCNPTKESLTSLPQTSSSGSTKHAVKATVARLTATVSTAAAVGRRCEHKAGPGLGPASRRRRRRILLFTSPAPARSDELPVRGIGRSR